MKSIHVLVGIYSLIFIFILGIGAYELWFDSEGDFLLSIFAVIILGVILIPYLGIQGAAISLSTGLIIQDLSCRFKFNKI